MTKLSNTIEEMTKSSWVHVAVIFLFCYVSFALPLQLLGLPSGFDMLTNIRFATAFQDAIVAGQYFPSWADDNFGYGSIGIRFYPPLSSYLLALTHLLTNDWFLTFLTNLFLWMFIGCVGIYFFVKEWSTPWQGLLAAMLYAVVPQHLGEIFQFFMFGQFAAWGTLPFCFLFVTRICRGGKWTDVVLFAVSFSTLILTHLPTTIIVSFCLPIYVLFLIDWSNFKRIFVHLAAGIGLTLLATSFRWVMLVSELQWIAHNGPEHYATGYYDFSLWLFPNILANRSMLLYVMTSWLFDIAIVLTVALAIPAVITLLLARSNIPGSPRKILFASLATGLFAFFMLSRPSFYIWDNVVLLQKIQFPWRWLSVLSLFSILLFTLAVPFLVARFQRFQRLVAYPSLALVVAIILFDITQIIIPSAPLPSAEFAEVEAKIRTEQIWKGWWPTWAREAAFENTEKVVAANRSIEITNWGRESKEFVVQPGDSTIVGVQSFYYPRWKATVNDREATVGMDENGAITIPVSNELSRVRLYFEEPLSINAAFAISGVTWLFAFGVILFVYGRKYFRVTGRKSLLDQEYDFPRATNGEALET